MFYFVGKANESVKLTMDIESLQQPNSYHFCPMDGFLTKESAKGSTRQDVDFEKLNPCLRTLLVTDGTVSKVLESYFWEPVRVEPLLQEECILSSPISDLSADSGDRALHRFVSIRGIHSGRLYVLAESYLLIDRLSEDLRKELLLGRLGIGGLLRDRKLETRRRILRFYIETASDLAHKMDVSDDEKFLSRDYTVNHCNAPIILIQEKFPIRTYREL